MKRQRGQAMVEFALMFPLMALMIFGMIYGAIIFMEYLDFSNGARTIARNIAVLENEDKREDLILRYGFEKKFTRFYTATRTIEYTYDINDLEEEDPIDIVVKVTFTRNNKDLPWILYKVGFPPETIKPIEYHMKLEKKNSSS